MPYERIELDRLHKVRVRVYERMYEPLVNLALEAWVTPEPVAYQARTAGTRLTPSPGDKWGELWDCAWFHFSGRVPQSATGQTVVLLIDVNGEVCLVDQEGSPVQGLTNVNTAYEHALGAAGKRVVDVSNSATGNEVIDLWGDAGCNDLFGKYRGGTLKQACIAICHEETRKLYYDMEVLLDLAVVLPDKSARRHQVLRALYDASVLLVDINDQTVKQARERLAPELAKRGGDCTFHISAIGHAHIDLAWLWPIRETIRKGARTFATALRFMEKYPDYIFGSSQPQLFQWMKEHYPKLYTQITDKVHEGRIEPLGAMWVEPDTNVPSGESLVRQVLYGKRFFRQEFDRDINILWLPDTFGYTASLPQILRKSGVDYMLTQKLSWNAVNDHPHHTFLWEGIDGSKVLTHLPPEDTYNSSAAPSAVMKTEEDYYDKAVSDRSMLIFGVGDGGGGPGENHLERLAREQDLLGLAPVKQEFSTRFFADLAQNIDLYQTWKGELYLEFHQGTLTSQARNKWYNRRIEKMLRELEFAAVLAQQFCGLAYPSRELDEIWKEVLLYQFHDILPGSSITRVYDESLARYAVLYARVDALLCERYQAIAREATSSSTGESTVVFNALPWERTAWFQIDGVWRQVAVPSMGYRVISSGEAVAALPEHQLVAETDRLENDVLRVTFNLDGTIASVFDKQHQRETIAPGTAANRIVAYHDDGNAWDFPSNYYETPAIMPQLLGTSAEVNGPEATVKQVYQLGESTITQFIMLKAGERLVEFRTSVDWRESGKMLRSSFSLNLYTDEVACEVQFGHIKRNTHRNTSWDFARDEICAHHWIDLSQPDYGVALLNDSKYGHRARGNVLDINLLRSTADPDPIADRAEHQFTYALLPHLGDYVASQVYRAGYELNVPLRVERTGGSAAAGESGLGETYTAFAVDHPQVMLETVKKAEDSEAVVVRLYETAGGSATVKLTIYLSVERAELVNLMEDSIKPLEVQDGVCRLTLTPFEIVSVRVWPRAN